MNEPVRILMIDDDEEDYIITRDIVSQIDHYSYTLDWCDNYFAGIKKILTQHHDVYLVDYQLGPNNGLDLVSEAISRGCEAPLILLTAKNDIEIDKAAMKAGASDYLLKGRITPRNLESSIRYSIQQAKTLREIKILNTELENRVKARTLVLEEAVAELNIAKNELNIALQKEKDLNDLKSRFVTMASHEFRTPLATILSSLNLLSKYKENGEVEKQGKHIERIHSSVVHMTDILNDILSISKLEEGKTTACYEDFNVKEFVFSLVTELKQLMKKGQETAYMHSGNENIYLDKKVLKNILFNLVSNAIKFSPEGKKIEIYSEVNGINFVLRVKDYGIGISEEDQQHLFERFFRGQNVINIQGTGLGLNIVTKYVEMLDGEIGFKSGLEKGTEFIITLPHHKK